MYFCFLLFIQAKKALSHSFQLQSYVNVGLKNNQPKLPCSSAIKSPAGADLQSVSIQSLSFTSLTLQIHICADLKRTYMDLSNNKLLLIYLLNSLIPDPQTHKWGLKSATKRRFRFYIRDYVLKPINYYFLFLSPFGESTRRGIEVGVWGS